MKNLKSVVMMAALIGIISCEKDPAITPEQNNGGVNITFANCTDDMVPEWYNADLILKEYNWKATFCVALYNNLDPAEINMLHDLKDGGHEIGGHGYLHLDAAKIIDSLGIEEYLKMEIDPMIDSMAMESFSIRSFAYPFGSKNEETDNLLLKNFDMLRTVGWGGDNPPSSHNCYFDGSHIVYSLCIDTNLPYFEGRDYEQYILDLLTYARDNDKILSIYSHNVVDEVTDEYQTSIATYEMICDFVRKNNMKFYTLSDLKEKIN